MIKCLSKEVQAKLRSGIAISSLQQCVEELILNSIDADATCVGVRIDMEAWKIQVIDNGKGMELEDMDSVGNRYFTSKCSSVEDLDNLKLYGFRGEAVASIVSLATLVEISSRTKLSIKTHVKVFKDGQSLNVVEAGTTRPSFGTTVIICNFFHNMPVRRKRLDPVLEGERIRQRLEAISLMHPSVSFTLKNDCAGAMVVQLSKAKNTYHRFVQIYGLGRAQKLAEISHTCGQINLTGYIGREGHYNNSLQFLYVNERLLLKTRVHKLLNLLLRSSVQKNDSPEGQLFTRSPKHKRSQELHGVYILNIKCGYSEYDICLEPAKTLIEFKDWDGILLCIEDAVKMFLNRENLVVELSQDDLECASPKCFATAGTEQVGNSSYPGIQATIDDSLLECNIGKTLASELVHRKVTVDGLLVNNNGQMECSKMEQDQSYTNGESRDEPQSRVIKLSEGELYMKNSPENVANSPKEAIQKEVAQIPIFNLELENKYSASQNIASALHSSTHTHMYSEPQPPRLKNVNSHTSAGDRKIFLSDPYIHEGLRPVPSFFCQQVSENTCQQNTCALKRQSSILTAGSRGATDSLEGLKDIPNATPSKVLKVVSSPRLSLSNEVATLDMFRRTHGKCVRVKLPSVGGNLSSNDIVPRSHNLRVNCQRVPVGQKEGQDIDTTETQGLQIGLKSPPTLSAFTRLISVPHKDRISEVSLASKLSHLKQQKPEASQSRPPCPLGDTSLSLENTCSQTTDNNFQDSNSNEQACCTTLEAECTPRFSASPQRADEDEITTSGDWLHHYDDTVGKIVYVNRQTGLSRYEDPAAEETEMRCTSDVANMAVSVISKTGMEYRCYPFQMDVVLNFLPKAKTKRVLSSGPDDGENDTGTVNSLSSLYSKWKNPVFVRPPMVGVDISSEQADGLAVKIHHILFPYRFSKSMVHSMKVINQVDKKFIACLSNTRDEEPSSNLEDEGNLLVLVDQHAAHERVRLEKLIADSYEDDPDVPGEKRLCSASILPPLAVTVTEEELRLLRSCQTHLKGLGLDMEFSPPGDPGVLVSKVPLCFTEKESNELKRGRRSVIKPIVEEYLLEQLELLRSTGRVTGTLPLTILKVLASLACHGAIKFNDSLNREECCSLVRSLSSCQLPFQCAHGRPSMTPLVDIFHLDSNQKDVQKPNLGKLRRMYKAWELYENR